MMGELIKLTSVIVYSRIFKRLHFKTYYKEIKLLIMSFK